MATAPVVDGEQQHESQLQQPVTTSRPPEPPSAPSPTRQLQWPPLKQNGAGQDDSETSLPPLSTVIPAALHGSGTWPIQRWDGGMLSHSPQPQQNGPASHAGSQVPGTATYRLDGGIRQRVAIACVYCRHRKIRCSGHLNVIDGKCLNCAHFKRQCVFRAIGSGPPAAFIPLLDLSGEPRLIPQDVPGPPASLGHQAQSSYGGADMNYSAPVGQQSPAPAMGGAPPVTQGSSLQGQRPVPQASAENPLADGGGGSIMRLSHILEANLE